jgi:ATP-binding cassette subfamily G (WHITE) protein 1
VELITSPSILFLDEPTSGLDSYAAFTVINILKDLALSGCTVLCTIHQPSSEVFHLFDRVLLLSEGRSLYDGPVDGLCPHLDRLGHPAPPETNPADHVMFLMQTLGPAPLAVMCDAFEAARGPLDPHAAAARASPPPSLPPPAGRGAPAGGAGLGRRQAGALTQFAALGLRDARNTVRVDPATADSHSTSFDQRLTSI